MRLSRVDVDGSSGSPFSVTSCTVAPTRSANVLAPGSLQVKRITVVRSNTVSESVRSRSTV